MDLQALLEKQEDLHPDLQLYWESKGVLGPQVRHPLLYVIPCIPQFHAVSNQQYLAKKGVVEKAKAEKDWGRILAMYERPYRMTMLKELSSTESIDESRFWSLFHEMWVDSENLYCEKAWLRTILRGKYGDPRQIMDEEERAKYESLPEQIVVYRGCTAHNKVGFSWTLNRDKAKWFARRFYIVGKTLPLLLTATINKKDVAAVILGRDEQEVVLPRQPKNVREEKV